MKGATPSATRHGSSTTTTYLADRAVEPQHERVVPPQVRLAVVVGGLAVRRAARHRRHPAAAARLVGALRRLERVEDGQRVLARVVKVVEALHVHRADERVVQLLAREDVVAALRDRLVVQPLELALRLAEDARDRVEVVPRVRVLLEPRHEDLDLDDRVEEEVRDRHTHVERHRRVEQRGEQVVRPVEVLGRRVRSRQTESNKRGLFCNAGDPP